MLSEIQQSYLEYREQKEPLRDHAGPNSVTNGAINIRQDEMDSRINKGNKIQKYSFYLSEPKNRHITREPGEEVASRQGEPATVRANTTSSR